MLINSPNISGSLRVTGNIIATGSLTVGGTITGTVAGTTATASYVEYTNVANKPALVSGSSQVTYSGLTGIPSGIISGSAQITGFGIFATTGSNQFNGSQTITGSLTTTGTIVAQTLNVQQVTSSIVYSSGSNIFGNNLSNTQQFTGSVGMTGSLAVAGALNGTSASFTDDVSLSGIKNVRWGLDDGTANARAWGIRNGYNASGDFVVLSSSTNNTTLNTVQLQIARTGAATFSSSVTANGAKPQLYVIGDSGNGAGIFLNTLLSGTNRRNWAIFTEENIDGDFAIKCSTAAGGNPGAGNTRLQITRDGNVGIGTASPDQIGYGAGTILGILSPSTDATNLQLGIVGSSGATSGTLADINFFGRNGTGSVVSRALIRGGIDGAVNSNLLSFWTMNAGTLAERMRISSTGTSTFSSPNSIVTDGSSLNINIRTTTALGADIGGTIGLGGLYNSTAGTEYGVIAGKKENSTINNIAGYLAFYTRGGFTDPIERMRITSLGNVGIGTASPSAADWNASATLLHLYQNSTNGSVLKLESSNTSGILAAFNNAMGIGTTSDDPVLFYTNTTERMRITSGGYLKASNTGSYHYPTNNFHSIESNIADWTCAVVSQNASSPNGILINYVSAAPNTFTNNFLFATDQVAVRFLVYSNGGIGNYQANDTNLSDERTKKDIEPLESYWDKFKAIEIVKFKYKDQTHDDFNIGVIAQQVESVAPEFVDVDGWNNNAEGHEIVSEEEPFKSIYTADLYHATIKVLQEAMAKIEEQQTLIESLKSRIDTLEQA